MASDQRHARRLVERLALADRRLIAGSIFAAGRGRCICRETRLAGDAGHAFGTLPPSVDCDAIIERAFPSSPLKISP